MNPKRVRRLLRLMGLETVYPKPRRGLSRAAEGVRKYPYLLRDVAIVRPDQVWAADITYVPLSSGWLYLTAILDWHSRYVVSWEMSLGLEADFCVAALERALATGRRPEICNTDHGPQFTSQAWTKVLEGAAVAISMDGRGRVFDNIFVERLWRTVKYEEVYLRDYAGPREARQGLERYFGFYNQERSHAGLGYRTPLEVYGALEERRTDRRIVTPGEAAWNAAGTAVALRAPSVPAASRR